MLALHEMPKLVRKANSSHTVEGCSSLPPLKYIAILLVSTAPLHQGPLAVIAKACPPSMGLFTSFVVAHHSERYQHAQSGCILEATKNSFASLC